jgi:Lrp/AsnC family transcriptional regulator for asnA, asnC and gidA
MTENPEIDQLDKQILAKLIEDGKMPYTDIAKQLFVSSGTIHVRMKKMEQLIVLVAERAKMTFTSLLGNPASRIERVLNFLALLEMVKQSAVQVQQVEHHGEIHISRV